MTCTPSTRVGYWIGGLLMMLWGGVAVVYAFLASLISIELLGVALLGKSVLLFWRIGYLLKNWTTDYTSPTTCGGDGSYCGKSEHWIKVGRFVFNLFSSLLALAGGILLMTRPLAGLVDLTAIVGIYLVVNGAIKILMLLTFLFRRWYYVLLHGLISLGLGILILVGWPRDSFWLLGLFVGIDIFCYGLSWVITSFAGTSDSPPVTCTSMLGISSASSASSVSMLTLTASASSVPSVPVAPPINATVERAKEILARQEQRQQSTSYSVPLAVLTR